MCFGEFSMLVEGHLVELLFLAKCFTLLKYCVNKIKIEEEEEEGKEEEEDVGFPKAIFLTLILPHCSW